MRIKNFLLQNKEILILLLVYVVLYSFNLDKFPVINSDENWFINPAYDLVVSGNLGTTMIYGFYNIANFTYWQPPVYFLLLATSFKLFGFGIVQARMVSVFLGFLTVLFTYLLGFKLYGKKIGLLASLLLVVNPLFFLISRNARMEVAVACFMVIALYFTFMALKDSRSVYYFAAAFFSILAVLSHPNGVIAVLAVLLIILMEKLDFKELKFNLSFNEVFIFILGIVIPLIPYLWYISLDFEDFKGQFMANIGVSPSDPLGNIVLEPTRFVELFWWFIVYDNNEFLIFIMFAVVGILAVLGLYHVVRERKFSDKFLLIILMVTASVFSVIVYHKYYIYLGFIIPYGSILIALTLKDKLRLQMNKKGIMSLFIVVLWVVLIVGNCIFIDNFLEKTKDYNYNEIKYKVQSYIPPGSVVVGDHIFWMALQDDYKYYGLERIQSNRIKTSDMMRDLKAEYILFSYLWEKDESTMNFVSQNCTLITEIPIHDPYGLGLIKVYRKNDIND